MRIVLFYLTYVILTPTFSQSWTTFNPSNSGLPHESVQVVTMDDSDNIWFGTENGLAKFDGTTWSVYNTTNSGISDNIIRSLAFEKLTNTIWIGTLANGLCSFDGSTWINWNTANSNIPGNLVKKLVVDPQGVKWMSASGSATGPTGLTKLDGTDFFSYSTSNSGIPQDIVTEIAISDDGDVWIGTKTAGAAKFSNNTWENFNKENFCLPSNLVTSIVLDEGGDVWIGTYGTEFLGSLASYDGSTWRIFEESLFPLDDIRISALASDFDGKIWIGTVSGGVAVLDGIELTAYNTTNSVFPSDDILDIQTGNNGSMWICTDNAGIARYIHTASVNDYSQISYSISPNPMVKSALITFQNPDKERHLLLLYDHRGRAVYRQDVETDSQLILEKGNLHNGLYFFQLFRKNDPIVRGRIIIN